MTGRTTRLLPYAQVTGLVILVVVVIVTAPFSTPRPGPAGPADGAARIPAPSASVVGTRGLSILESENPKFDPHELLAEKVAEQLLEDVQVPAGAIQVSTLPAATPDMNSPPQMIGVTQVVDDHRFWIAPGTTGAVIGWFGEHAIPGSVLVGHGSDGTYSAQQLVYDVFYVSSSGAIVSRELLVGVAQDATGQTVVRVDSQIVWEPTRPSQSMVPVTVARVVVTESPPPTSSGRIVLRQTRRSSSPAIVHRFMNIVNAMPEANTGFRGCPEWSGDLYTLVFQSNSGSTVTTVSRYEVACFGISIKVPGVATVALSDPGDALLDALEAFVPLKRS